MRVQTVDASGSLWARQDDAGPPTQGGAPWGALVEAEVSCTWCCYLQLFPPDRVVGQCHGDSAPSVGDEQ